MTEKADGPVGKSLVKPSREIRSLTGIRGVAAGYVVFHHWFQGTPSFHHLAYTLRGYLSVDLFFVLSGFVMTLTYRSSLTSGRFDAKAYGDFIYKRLARIYPVYFVIVIVIYALSRGGLLHEISTGSLAANLLLIQAWGLDVRSVVGPGWSISTEFAVYFAFPLIAVLALGRSTPRFLVTVVFAIACILFTATRSDADLLGALRYGPLDVYTSGTPYPLIRCFGGFTLGVIACRLASTVTCTRLFGRPYAADVVFLIVLVALRFPAMDVAIVVLFALFVISLSYERSFVSRLLGWGFVYYSGVISYSLYLIHGPLNETARQPLEHLLAGLHVVKVQGIAGVLLLAPLILLAMACFHGIEKPARDASRALGLRKAFG